MVCGEVEKLIAVNAQLHCMERYSFNKYFRLPDFVMKCCFVQRSNWQKEKVINLRLFDGVNEASPGA